MLLTRRSFSSLHWPEEKLDDKVSAHKKVYEHMSERLTLETLISVATYRRSGQQIEYHPYRNQYEEIQKSRVAQCFLTTENGLLDPDSR